MVKILKGSVEPWAELLHGNGDGNDGNGNGNGYGDGNDGDGNDGYGYGYGYGDGYGNGYGYGDGYGNGYGNGDGNDGNGNGYGDGNGDGYGYGYGDGYGDGNGNGYGNSEDSQVYWMRSLNSHPLPFGSVLAYWRSNSDGSPANGGTRTRAKIGLVEEIKGPLQICTQNALHATFNPPKWNGQKVWIVAMYPPFQFDDDKIAALKRKIIAEADFKL